ncbi:hypothetical protein AC578_9630 [Pseudocercospora eumusae]|uniref:Metallo-dependent hydrolase n=1 Tax=Pseudocercospora eumusae TaxID=321146 RepID=A0A139H184_9PEZI|nr:hypothetical protein AC578_9630 [Pseudocercospora eumusae]
MAGKSDDDGFPWHLGVFDAHCHPTDTLSSLHSIPSMRAKVLTVMATRAQDQELVANAADQYGANKQRRIVPAFGWHPWFSHHMYDESDYGSATALNPEQKAAHYQSVLTPKSDDRQFLDRLPDPMPFGVFISQTRQYLQKYPLALIGEVGLDRSFRIPEAWLPGEAEERDENLTPGGREGRRLSPYRVSMDHQRKVLSAQLALAGEMSRAVSCHGVAAHGIVYETVAQTWKGHERKTVSKRARKEQQSAVRRNASGEDQEDSVGQEAGPKPYPPRLCLHSYSGPAETIKQYTDSKVPCEIFFSFSTTINAWSEDGNGKVEAAVKAVPDDRILVESDLHTAGEHMDRYLQQAVEKICQVKGWELEDGVIRLGQNWKRFAFGGDWPQSSEATL